VRGSCVPTLGSQAENLADIDKVLDTAQERYAEL
jgi:hypothetical protein